MVAQGDKTMSKDFPTDDDVRVIVARYDERKRANSAGLWRSDTRHLKMQLIKELNAHYRELMLMIVGEDFDGHDWATDDYWKGQKVLKDELRKRIREEFGAND
jgi:hypothetical protein